MTPYDLFEALRPHYPREQFALLPQAANGTGSKATRHADGLALGLWPSRGIHLHGFEIKLYRSDWLRELKNPQKAEDIAQYCNFWWLVAAHDAIVLNEELPLGWGLMVYDQKDHRLAKVKSAPFHEAKIPDLAFIAGILRKAQEVCTPEDVIKTAQREAHAKGQEDGKVQSSHDLKKYAELRSKVHEFEKASGVKLEGSWETGKNIGDAVRSVLNGGVNRDRRALLEIASRLVRDLTEL